MEDSDTPMGVAFSWTERQLCLLKVTANIIRFNCRARILAEKKMEEALRMAVIDFPLHHRRSMSAQRQRPIDFARSGLLIAHRVGENCGIRG